MKHTVFTLFIVLFSRANAQSDTAICLECNFKKRASFIEEQSDRLQDTSVIVKVYDYTMTYINSLRIQEYLRGTDTIDLGVIPTYSYRFKKKYYRKIYNKLKVCDSVEYIGMMPDEHIELGVNVMHSLAVRSKVKSKKEIEVYNELVRLSYLDDYDIPFSDIYWLFDNILSYADQLNMFENKPLVVSLCENYLRNKGKEYSMVENKMVIVYETRSVD